MSLSGSWRFVKGDISGGHAPTLDDSGWSRVTVPHTWNNVDGQDGPGSGGGQFGLHYYRGVGWYRRHVSLPSSFAGRKLFLQFDGASLVADVWVNGQHVGRHEGGFTIFRFDVTPFLSTAPGNDNVIAVKVDNANGPQIAPLSGDFTIFGGLYRDVSLLAVDPLSADLLDYGSPGVYLSQTAVSHASANLRIKTLLDNRHPTSTSVSVRTVIVDADSSIVQEVVTPATLAANSRSAMIQNVTIATPRLWDGLTDPYLYAVHVEIREGSATGPVRDVVPPQPLGFRFFSLDPNQGFILNGHHLSLNGVNRHQDRLNKGWAISQSDQDEDMRLIKEMGATSVRLAHYPHAQYFYGLADREGMIVWAELPVVDRVGDQGFASNARQQLIELIRQSYNHPSIVFWSVANEARYPPDPNPLLAELHALSKQEDPYRLTTLAHCCLSDTDPITTRTDTIGYNKYFGWYEWNYDAFGYWADLTHTANPTKTFSISEYGAGASIFLHAQNPPLSLSNHTEEYQALFHEAYWMAMKTRPYLWGTYVWNMFDFASDGRTEGDTDGRNDKGLVTYDRQTRKDAFYWYKANWTTSPMVYITSRRWTQRTSPNTEIKVYSNADAVELRVNGISLGTIADSANRIFRWTDVVLRGGANTVEAIATAGATVVADAVSWNVGQPKVAILTPLADDMFAAPAAIDIAAVVADGSVTKVEFYRGSTKLGEDTSGADGWSLRWTNVPAGHYILTARSTDNTGASTMSAEVPVTVEASANSFPTVAITTPAHGATFPEGAGITLVANATDADGTVEKVTFLRDGTIVGEDAIATDGWRATIQNAAAGTYMIAARATDNLGATRTSALIRITVGGGNQPPTVSIVSPVNGATFSAPATVTVSAVAADVDGAVSKVEFFQGTTKLGEDTNAAGGWTFSWNGVPAGVYALTAVATDDDLAAATSAAAGITVGNPGFSANINFQPASAPTVPGYLVDAGAPFANRGNGFTYGWSLDNAIMARDRNSPSSPDQRYDTLVHMGALSWEIAVPNGTYNVRAVVGDPSFFDVNSRLTIEGVAAVTGLTGAASPWLQGTVTVTVTDGRLTVANQLGSYNKICFVEIWSAGAANQPPSVSISSPAAGATFTAPVTVSITAQAADSDGTIAKVEFFGGAARIGEDVNGSDGWSVSWANVPAGTHDLSARAVDNLGATTTSALVAITVNTPPPPPPPASLLLDVGGGGYTDSAGRVWQPDTHASGGTVSSKPNSIGNTTDDDLYRTYRFGTFGYNIPVANGTYDVLLKFVEPWWDAPSHRIFSVSAEGSSRLTSVDLFAIAGKFNAVDRRFTVIVSDGMLNLAFASSIDNALVSAIEVTRQP